MPNFRNLLPRRLLIYITVATLLFGLLDPVAVNRPDKSAAAAMGPCLLFQRDCYDAIGGHHAVRGEVVEDLRLAQLVKRDRLGLDLCHGVALCDLRMYDSLPALLRELSGFLGDPEVLLVIGNRGDEQPPLAQRLALLGLELDPLADESHPLPGAAGLRIELPQGGNVTIFTHRGQHLSDFAVSCLQQKPPVDAVVFLSEPDAQDRDARTGMRVLRFADALEAGKIPRGPQLHVLAEFLSRAKGERVAALLRNCKDKSLRVTLVSTDQIKEYFLVRSAFVPGVTAIYGELLSRAGQAMIRLQPPERLCDGLRGELRFADVREALLPRGIIPLALQLAPQDKEPAALRLNPGPHEVFPASRLSGIYAIAALGDEDPRTQEAPSEDLADWRLAGGGVELGAGG